MWFLGKSKSFKPCKRHTDALVALTGDEGRVDEGLNLLKKGRGSVLFISGIQTSKRATELFNKSPKHAKDNIVLGRRAFDTIGNAHETAQWLVRTPNISSLYIITSDYHMLRSQVVFNAVLKNYDICWHPVKGIENKSVLFLFKEYTKYVLATIWHRVVGMKGNI
ncbi:MAG: YdcF family protein [Alphaproteobacteria bacterium]|nr:YdcF family protein [Alphaproteobacteria bacterium]MBN2779779.1 YdcF family protein [Alphaproteobacteria bacterium]